MAQLRTAALVYPAMRSFTERCLVNDLSLLWPTEPVWTPETLERVKERFVVGALFGDDRNFVEKLRLQFDPLPGECWRLFADALFIYSLPSLFLKNKYGFIRDFIGIRGLPLPAKDDPVWQPFAQGFSRTGHRYHLKYPQLRLLLLFAESIKRRSDRQAFLADPDMVKGELDRLLQSTTDPKERAADMRHALLHMMFPERYERIISTRDKEWIVQKYGSLIPPDVRTFDVDGRLGAIRCHFEGLPKYRDGFDFYDLKTEWRPAGKNGDEDDGDDDARREEQGSHVWIFQANPEFYKIREAVRSLSEQTWLVAQHRDRIRPGDRVFLWESGPDGGIVGRATVQNLPQALPNPEIERPFVVDPSKFEGVRPRVVLRDVDPIDPPLSRDTIRAQNGLTRLRIFRQPQGTNYPVTDEEAAALDALLAGRPPEPPPPPRPPRKLAPDWLSEHTLWPKERLESLVETFLGPSPQIVLAGPPGTSKTWIAKHLARFVTADREGAVRIVQFHPSYSYEQFIEGLRPVVERGGIQFSRVDGVVLELVRDIKARPGLRVLVIDEMNRANLPSVFGELMYLFEYRNERIRLQYSGDFALPGDLKFIGTMNTADRSIRSIDVALRRRFDVFECLPDRGVLERYYASRENAVPDLIEGFERLNDALRQRLDRHHTIGHAFFLADPFTPERLLHLWVHKLGPLIEEYFFDQPDIAASFGVSQFWRAITP
jgi:5-methylcytosine-specific restriction enzyme B